MSKLTTLAALLALSGCVAPTAKLGDVPDLATGKADGSLEVVDNGPIAFGEDHGNELERGVAHAWTFTLGGTAEVTFTTAAGGEQDVDTVLYVHDEDDNELAVDDDGGPGLYSSLTVALDAGSYRVTVTGYGDAAGAFALAGACVGEACGNDVPVEPADPWALAREVDQMHVELTDETPIPESFERASGTSPVSLSSPEWWQRWSGGSTQSFSWSEGTDYGKRCGQASAIRLQAIWDYEVTDAEGVTSLPGREAFQRLLDGSGWSGTMYNWTEDISEGGRASFSPATMWAWRTGAVKFINVVHPDGSCDLPTLSLVQEFSSRCLAQAEREDGAIQGCRVSGR